MAKSSPHSMIDPGLEAALLRRVAPPVSEADLLQRARELVGLPLSVLAARAGLSLPDDPRRTKGLVGILLERLLGADAASRPVPDFSTLEIELKTIPIGPQGVPTESTFLCIAPLKPASGLRWEDSPVRRKLRRILWMPIESDAALALASRRVGWPVLWSPTAEQEQVLRADWEELMELLATSAFDRLDARLGSFLQVRPKAANGRALAASNDAEGLPAATLPRGFYLRPRLTRVILGTSIAR